MHVWDKPGLSGYLVCLVHLVSFMQPNKPDRPNRPNEQNGLVPHPSGELRKQLPRKVAGIGWVDDILAAKIVVEDSAIGGFVHVGQAEIHVVAFDGAGYATDEDHGAIRLLPFDDPDMRQRVVHLAIPVEVPRVVEKHEVGWVDNWSLMKRTLFSYVRMDEPDAIGFRIVRATVVQIDAVFEEDGSGDTGAVVGDVPALALNRVGAYELGRCPHNRGPARAEFGRAATGVRLRC